MKYTVPILLAATLVVAAPASNSTLDKRMFQGSINWYQRWDCHNPCVETGYCLSGEETLGMKGSDDPWIGWDTGCWDRPDGVHSLGLSISNGHKFSVIDVSCAAFKASNYADPTWPLNFGDKNGDQACNVLPNNHGKAVFYHW